jgi:thiamine pyrophosphokinase
LQILIVANGAIDPEVNLAIRAKQADFLIAVDGGADYCVAVGIIPDIVIGDLDSISLDVLNRLKQAEIKILSYPVEKDFTDLELALKYAVNQPEAEILILGGLGTRWDMSLANLMLLGADFLENRVIRMIGGNQEAVLVRSEQQITIYGGIGNVVSLIPLCSDAKGVTTQGLRYPLDNETLFFAATRGISNQLRSKKATVYLRSGLLLCIHFLNEDN